MTVPKKETWRIVLKFSDEDSATMALDEIESETLYVGRVEKITEIVNHD